MLPRPRRAAAVVALTLSPLFVVCAGVILKATRGAAWLGWNADPEYLYLFNSLVILRGRAPWHIDHPGTPLQMLGAAVIRILFASTGHGTIEADVVNRPEAYVSAIHLTSLVVAALLIFGAGVAVWRRAGLVPALILQWAPWLSVPMIGELARLRPEPLLVAASMCLGAIFIRQMDGRTPSGRFARAAGAWTGACLALKLTALPLLAGPPLVARDWKSRRVFATTTVVAFLIGISAALRKLPSMLHWAWRLVTHSGNYGSGSTTVVDPGRFLPALATLVAGEPLVTAIVAISLVTWVLWLRGSPETDVESRRILGAVCCVEVFQFLTTAKHPAPHYLAPAIALVGVNGAGIWRYATHAGRVVTIRAALATSVAVALIVQVPLVGAYAHELDALRVQQETIARTAESTAQRDQCVVIAHYRASSEAFALAFGAMSATFQGITVAPDLAARFPRALFDRGAYTIVGFDWREPFDLDRLMRTHTCVLVLGTADNGAATPAPFRLEPILAGADERLSRLAYR